MTRAQAGSFTAPIRYSTLPSPPVIGLSVSPITRQPSAGQERGHVGTGARDRGGVADDAALADECGADLELRLDQGDEHRAGPREVERGRQRLGERDEREVRRDPVGGRNVIGGQVAGVETFDEAHARIGAKRRIELTVADIDGPDRRRAGTGAALG